MVKLAAVLAAKKPTTTEAIKPANDIKSIRIPGASVFQAKISDALVPLVDKRVVMSDI